MSEEKKYYQKSLDDIYLEFNSSIDGLSKKQVKINKEKYGKNALLVKEKKSKTRVFLEQFQDILVIILIIAAIISLFIGQIESTIVIFIVLFFNALLSTIEFFKAEKSLESLKKLSSTTSVVIREKNRIEIPSDEIVVGDIVILKSGDIVPADGRIISSSFFEVNESSLTGEATPVNKVSDFLESNIDGALPIADQKNMAFSSTSVNSGYAKIIITKVGINTEIGKIASLMDATELPKTPLQKSLDSFSKKLAILIILVCFVVFALSLYRNIAFFDSLMFAVALAVAAIPEALSTIVVIVLALGTQKMANERAIVKELKAVEGLGCVNVILTDKTGTLTENNMIVSTLYINELCFNADSFSIKTRADKLLLDASVLCSEATVEDIKNNVSSTEVALLKFANKHTDIKKIKEEGYRLDVFPFTSKRKCMYTLNSKEFANILYVKGASEIILKKSKRILVNNKIDELDNVKKEKINEQIILMSKTGLRVLGIAYKEFSKSKTKIVKELDEENLIFIGLVGLIDPPKKDVKESIMEVKRASIKPVMITGDHELTAVAIAKATGIIENDYYSLTGTKIDSLTDDELDKIVPNIDIFARVSPENKIRIVSSWQRNDKTVAFVGDGVNDAPALKKANIGISMGKTGTEVSKEASSMILMDDNYLTIIKAIKNGRNIYDNIQNAIRFLISGNIAGIIAVLYTTFLALPVPFAAVHLLFINLLTDSLPAIAIGMENNKIDLSNQSPRKPKDSLLSRRVLRRVLVEGLIISLATIYSYSMGLKVNPDVARTCAFVTLCSARLFHSFNCRGVESIVKRKINNKFMIFSFFIGLILVNLVLFVPSLQLMFKIAPLDVDLIIRIYLLSFLPTIIIQGFMIMMEIIRTKKAVRK